MPLTFKDTTFLGWIEDFFKLPSSIPSETIALYYNGKKKTITGVLVKSSLTGETPTSIISEFTAGGGEALRDIKGINTVFNLETAVKKGPIEAIKALGNQTIKDIFELDETASDRRSELIENLTNGELRKKSGAGVDQPDSMILRGIKAINIPITDTTELLERTPTGALRSRIRLMGSHLSADPRDLKEDRRIVEEKTDREKQYKAYRDFAGALTGLAGYMESTGPRGKYYDESIAAYNRAIATEFKLDLDEILPVEKRRTYDPRTQTASIADSEGTFVKELKRSNITNQLDNINDLVNNDSRMIRALDITNPSDWNNLSTEGKNFFRNFLRSEFTVQDLYDDKKGILGGISAFDAEMGNVLNRWVANRTYPGKDPRSNLKKGIISADKRRQLLKAQIYSQVYEPQLMADIASKYSGDVDALQRARDRLGSARKSIEIANDLFFSSTTKEMLESLEKGKFVEVVLLNSRILSIFPFINKEAGSPMEYAQAIDKLGIGPINVGNAVKLISVPRDYLVNASGLEFSESDPAKLKGVANLFPKDSTVWVDWNREDLKSNGDKINRWTQVPIMASEAGGIFGEWGVYDTLKTAWGSDGKLFRDLGIPNPESFNPVNLMSDRGTLLTFLEDINVAAGNVSGGAVAATGMEKLAEAMGLAKHNNLTKFQSQLNLFKAKNKGADLLFNKLPGKGSFGLQANRRWDLITRLFKEGKAGEIEKPYIGLLNRYNRAANALYSFLYREILWDGYAGKNILIKGLIKVTSPIRALMQMAQMSDDVSLIQAIRTKWGIGKFFEALKNDFYAVGQGGRASEIWLGRALGNNFITKSLMRNAFRSALFNSLGYLASGVSAVIGAGIGYVIAGLGEAAWKLASNIFKGNIQKGISEALDTLKTKVKVVTKLVTYVGLLACGCILVPFFLIVIIAVSIVSPLERMTGGGAYQDVILSSKIDVEKTAVQSGSNIEYSIIINNITNRDGGSGEDVIIESFTDTLTFAKSCDAGGAIVDVLSDATYGQAVLPTISSLPSTTIPAGESITVPAFILGNITSDDGSYINSVEVTATGDTGKKATDSAIIEIGEGGCVTCPAGWPLQSFAVSQGPNTTDSHKGAVATDFATPIGQAVTATHNGQVSIGVNTCAEDDHSEKCGYGNYVKVTSPQGFATIYAHFSSFNVTGGEQVNAGDIIGYSGHSGFSTGPHLHYEFVNPQIQCIPGEPLRMMNLQNSLYPGSYIPQTIPSCVGSVSCNISR